MKVAGAQERFKLFFFPSLSLLQQSRSQENTLSSSPWKLERGKCPEVTDAEVIFKKLTAGVGQALNRQNRH